MPKRLFIYYLAIIISWVLIFHLDSITHVFAKIEMQIPTGEIPTVTGTAMVGIATVLQNEQGFANLRSGPNTLGYDIVGVLVVGQQVPALGKSPGGNWILIAYPGAQDGVAWVFSDLVQVSGDLPVVEPPATATPRITPTLDPTLAAQFPVEIQPTRLPTFTAPAPDIFPTFSPVTTQTISGKVPMALVIIGLGAIGIFGLIISFLRGR